jgi:hypothetical protein
MKTGIELIAKERKEQIEKHGWDSENDSLHRDGELVLAAKYAIKPYDDLKGIRCYSNWEGFTEKVKEKQKIERLAIAGALIAAEIDRLQNY